MKGLLSVLFLGLVVFTEARAAGFSCIGDKVKLDISHYQVSAEEDNSILGAKAVLTKGGALEEVLSGKYDKNLKVYDLKDIEGNLVDLKISKMTSYGGRCGRCTPELKISYYAKLTTIEEELDFTCFLK